MYDEEWPVCIQFCSDMHLEMPMETKRLGRRLHECKAIIEHNDTEYDEGNTDDNNILPGGKKGCYLALLGDIFDGQKMRDGTYKEFLLRQCPGYEAVFVLAGNHEFYRAEYAAAKVVLATLCTEVTQLLGGKPTVNFMDCTQFDLPGVKLRILGCTLWSNVGPDSAEVVASTLSDYSAIRVTRADGLKEKATVNDTNAWHAQELAWLQQELAQAQLDGCRCIVLTHHAPSFHGTCPPQHASSVASSGFCTSLEHLLQPPVAAWLFGHTHWSSWQKYRAPGAGNIHASWSTLSGGESCGGPSNSDFSAHHAVVETAAGEVLLASNQLGYGAKGGHRSSRCHPCMVLRVSRDGGKASLYCSP